MIEIGEWSFCVGGRLERFYCIPNYNDYIKSGAAEVLPLGLDGHDGDARRGVPGENGADERRGAAPRRQQAGVHVQHAPSGRRGKHSLALL